MYKSIVGITKTITALVNKQVNVRKKQHTRIGLIQSLYVQIQHSLPNQHWLKIVVLRVVTSRSFKN